ncbi:predicted protein [Streptomyces sp. SPB78]|nr:predicted protein [Streptomyces sp. SPB78]
MRASISLPDGLLTLQRAADEEHSALAAHVQVDLPLIAPQAKCHPFDAGAGLSRNPGRAPLGHRLCARSAGTTAQRIGTPASVRAMTSRWISLVPSKIV